MECELTVTSLGNITVFYLSNVNQSPCFLFINFYKALNQYSQASIFMRSVEISDVLSESSAELISHLLIIVDLVLQCCWYECTFLWNDKLV